jgi:hypothetical protein
VQRAPGIPHALIGGEKFMHDSGASRREARTHVCEQFGCLKIESVIPFGQVFVMAGLVPAIHVFLVH